MKVRMIRLTSDNELCHTAELEMHRFTETAMKNIIKDREQTDLDEDFDNDEFFAEIDVSNEGPVFVFNAMDEYTYIFVKLNG